MNKSTKTLIDLHDQKDVAKQLNMQTKVIQDQ